MLTDTRLEAILTRIPTLTIGVVGDLFLDRYLDLDAALTEKSLETGRSAYQVTGIRSLPGAAGTVINNLVALGVKRVCPVSVIGDDGEGYELRQALAKLGVVDGKQVVVAPERRTPTYTKPLLHRANQRPVELTRLDIKNRTALPAPLQDLVMEGLAESWPQIDALLVLDQVSEPECGVVTARLRELLTQLGEAQPDRFILADSRERIGLFRSVSVKPNERECREALSAWGMMTVLSGGGLSPVRLISETEQVRLFAERFNRPVFCTMGEQGIYLAKHSEEVSIVVVPAYPVSGPIDIVGAGDSTSAGIACAVAAGATLEEAAAFGNLVASVTIQQIGTTGTASPDQLRQRWREIQS